MPQGRHGGGNATGRGEHDEDWTWATCAQVRSQLQMSFGGAAGYPADGERYVSGVHESLKRGRGTAID